MDRSSHQRADLRPSLREVNRPLRKTNRYQYEQRFTWASWVWLLVVIVALSAWVDHRAATARSDSADDAATPPASGSASSVHVTLPSWLIESEPSINDLVVARNDIAAAAARHDIAKTGAACRSAGGAVAKVHLQLPSPEPALNSTLHDAVDSYDIGLPYCISATQTHDAEGMQRAAAYISRGDVAMREALDYLDRHSGDAGPGVAVLVV